MSLVKKLPSSQEAGANREVEDAGLSELREIQGRIILDYGDSGDGKSTRAHSFARYYFAKSGGKKVRLLAAEDSSRNVFKDLIDAGIVEAVFMTDSKSPLTTLERILVDRKWPIFDSNGKVTWQTEDEWRGTVSAYIVEGLTTNCELIVNYLTETGRFEREQKDGFSTDGKTFMAASQTAYGFTQNEGIKLLKNSGALPVQRVLWTAHEAKGKDEFGTEQAVRGPKLVGSAATDSVRKYVGVLLHSDRVRDKLGKEEVRVYISNHPDPKNPSVSWKAKVTLPPTQKARLDEAFPLGYFVPTLPTGEYAGSKDGLIKFLEVEDELQSSATDAAAKFRASISGK